MEDRVIRKYYNDYLKEFFDFDAEDYKDKCYIIKFASNNNFFINPRTGSADNYYEIHNFYDGYAVVKGPKGYNYINQYGELISKEWFTDAYDFNNGYGQVYKGNKKNYISRDGEFFFSDFRSEDIVGNFNPNGAGVFYFGESKPLVINAQRKKLFKNQFQMIHNFIGKNAIAEKQIDYSEQSLYSNKKVEYHIIDDEGNDFKTNYIFLEQVDEDIFIAYDMGGAFLINAKGERIGNNKFDSHDSGFKDGYMIVKKKGYYNLIGKDGEFVFESGFDSLTPPNNGICKVCIKDNHSTEYNYYDIVNKKFLSLLWFRHADDFHNGMAIVGDSKYSIEYRILYLDGTFSEKTFTTFHEATKFISQMEEAKDREEAERLGLVRQVENDNTLNYMLPDGTLLFPQVDGNISKMKDGVFAHYNNNNLSIYNRFGKKVTSLNILPEIDTIEGISIERVPQQLKYNRIISTKRWFRYNYEKNGVRFSLDYKPVVDYGDIIICEDEDNYYKFEKVSGKTSFLGRKEVILIDTNYIVIEERKYFISGTDFIDVSELPFIEKITKKDGVGAPKNYTDFKVFFESPEYQAKIASEMAKLKEAVEAEKRNRLAEEAKAKALEEQRILEEKKTNLRVSLNNLSDVLRECSKYITEIQGQINSKVYNRVIVPEELLLIEVGDHLEINPMFLNVIRFVDLYPISFKNVKVNGIDLSYTNAIINPQEVYKKDMSDGKYCGLNFNSYSFEGVNIANADFKDAVVDFAQSAEEVRKRI